MVKRWKLMKSFWLGGGIRGGAGNFGVITEMTISLTPAASPTILVCRIFVSRENAESVLSDCAKFVAQPGFFPDRIVADEVTKTTHLDYISSLAVPSKTAVWILKSVCVPQLDDQAIATLLTQLKKLPEITGSIFMQTIHGKGLKSQPHYSYGLNKGHINFVILTMTNKEEDGAASEQWATDTWHAFRVHKDHLRWNYANMNDNTFP